MGARETILEAAEELFASHGIDAVSLREITRAAGERNVTALQYHFTNRQGLVVAVLSRRAAELSSLMHKELDSLEHSASPSIRDLVAAFVTPLFTVARTPRGGRFVQISAEVIVRATQSPRSRADPLKVLVDDPDGAIRRWANLLDAHMSPRVNGGPLHQRFVMLRSAYIEVARRPSGRHSLSDTKLFELHLIDVLTAMAACEPSPATELALTEWFNVRNVT